MSIVFFIQALVAFLGGLLAGNAVEYMVSTRTEFLKGAIGLGYLAGAISIIIILLIQSARA